MRENYEIDIRWAAFPLHPETPEEGVALEDLFAGRGVDMGQMKARLRQVAEEEGLPLGERTRTYNSRLAQELGKWAESQGKGDQYHDRVFRAYFVDGRNIGRTVELVRLAETLSLSGEEAGSVLEKRVFSKAVDLDWSRARQKGVTAVPTFVLNHRALVGAQPYEALERFLGENHVKKRNLHP